MKNVSGNKKLVPPNCIGQDRGLGATKVATATRMDDLWPCGAAGGYAFCHLSRLISGVWRMEVWGLKQRFSRCVYYVTPVESTQELYQRVEKWDSPSWVVSQVPPDKGVLYGVTFFFSGLIFSLISRHTISFCVLHSEGKSLPPRLSDPAPDLYGQHECTVPVGSQKTSLTHTHLPSVSISLSCIVDQLPALFPT